MNAPNQLSFLPDDYLIRKAQRRTNIVCAMLFSVTIIAIGAAFTISERSVADLEAKRASIDEQYAEAARRIQQVQQMQEQQRRMARQAELSASLLEKVPRSFLLAELTNALPAGVSLLDFSLESRVRPLPPAPPTRPGDAPKKPEAPPVRQFDVFMKATGIAGTDVQVAQFISKLNQSKLLRDVNLLITDQYVQNSENLRKFQIEMMLDPDAEVRSEAPTKTVSVELSE